MSPEADLKAVVFPNETEAILEGAHLPFKHGRLVFANYEKGTDRLYLTIKMDPILENMAIERERMSWWYRFRQSLGLVHGML